MAIHCQKCGQSVLEDDVQCWHCGAKLRPGLEPVPEGESGPGRSGNDEEEVQPVSLSTTLFYAGMTAVIILALILLMRFLAQQPLYRLDPTLSRPAGWTAVTDQARRFTLNTPPEWQWFEPATPGQQSEYDSLRRSQPIIEMISSLAAVAGEAEVVMLATETEGEGFLLIARSPRLQQRSPQAVSAALAAENPGTWNLEETEDGFGQDVVVITKDMMTDIVQLRCREQIMAGPGAGYWLTICVPTLRYTDTLSQIELMANSFQPLLP